MVAVGVEMDLTLNFSQHLRLHLKSLLKGAYANAGVLEICIDPAVLRRSGR